MPRSAKLGTLAVVEVAPLSRTARRHPKPALIALALLGIQLGGAPGCGPSIQSIHEGSVRFEHCYRLDLDPKIAPSHRHACWEQWTRVYSYGQARDRIEYSRRRLAELEAGDPTPPNLQLDDSTTRPEREFYMSMPVPTDAHAPPPPMATTPSEQPARQQVPGDECIIRCRQQRSACLSRCEPGGAREPDAKPPAAPKPEPEPASDPQAESDADATDEADEAPSNECACEVDYKSCAMRCFE